MVGREELVCCQSLGRPILQRCLPGSMRFCRIPTLTCHSTDLSRDNLVCPVDSLVNTHPVPQVTMKTLDPCAWRYVLTQNDLASFRLKARSDVVGEWKIASPKYNYFYCQMKIVVSAHSFTSTISKTGKTHFSQQMDTVDSVSTKHTRNNSYHQGLLG